MRKKRQVITSPDAAERSFGSARKTSDNSGRWRRCLCRLTVCVSAARREIWIGCAQEHLEMQTRCTFGRANSPGMMSALYPLLTHVCAIFHLFTLSRAPERASGRANAFKRLNSKGKMLILGDAHRRSSEDHASSNSLSLLSPFFQVRRWSNRRQFFLLPRADSKLKHLGLHC